MTGSQYREYIKELIESEINYHEYAIEETKDFVFTPADRAWVNKHEKALEKAKQALNIWEVNHGD